MDNQQIKNFIETSRQSGISDDKIVSYLQSKGVNLQGQQEQPKSFGQKALDTAKATVGGFASGVGGVALTAEDYLARKGLFGEKVKTSMQGQPSLQEQFKKEMGGEERPLAYGVGQLGGEIAALAAPVSAVGSATSKGVQALGAGKNVAKLAQAGTEGVAFTAGQSLTEGEKMPLKDYAINAGLNMLIPAGGIVAKKAGENLPSRIVNSLIKPLQKDFAYGKNPGKVIADKGIVANNFEELITKVKQAKEETGNTIGELRAKSTTPITLDAESVIKPIDQAIAKANLTPRTNAALIQRLESVRQDILENIDNGLPPEQVKSLVGDLTKWTGNATDDQLVNKSLKGVYGSINSQMDDALKTGLSPEDFNAYKKANEQYGDLISAENASVYRDKILERQDLISFGAKNAGLITALSTAIATGGSAIPTILAGLGGTILDKTMATPAFKTRLAVLLRKLAPAEVNTFFEKVPTAKTLFNGDEIDNLINKVKETPNKQGGFAKLPYDGSKPNATTDSLTTTASKTATNTVIPKSSPKSNIKSREITPDLSLTGQDAKIQNASIAKYRANPKKLTQDYIKANGKIVNTDEARKLFKDVGYSGSNSAAVQEASSAVAKDVWKELLRTSKGNDVLIYAGGSGTGKTSAVKNIFPQEIKDAGAILDGNLSTMKSAQARIEESIKAGKYPNIVYVYRDPVDSWINGVIKRMKSNPEEGGRVVPLSVFIQNHKGSYEVIKNLLEDSANGIKYDVKMVDNSLGRGNQTLLSSKKFDNIKYKENLKDELLTKTKELYDKGEITKEEYEALIK